MQADVSPASPDWPLIQTLYASGERVKDLAARFNVRADTISSRASRRNWKRLVTGLALVKQDSDGNSVSPSQEIQIDEGLSKKARSRASRSILEALETLPIPGDWKQAAKLQSQLEPLVRNAKVVLGWGDDAKPSVVNIALMQHNTVEVPAVSPGVPQKVILISPSDVIETDP